MIGLVGFLRACLDEDEHTAQAAQNGPEGSAGWNAAYSRDDLDPSDWTIVAWPSITRIAGPGLAKADADHIACWDPVRVLAEIAAGRAVLDHAERWAGTLTETPDGWTPETCTAYRMAMEWTVRTLAQPYAGRPGWDDTWRTDA